MWAILVLYLSILCNNYSSAHLWKNGVVHYSINAKDYDTHSQDEISNALSQIEKEICVKFFKSPQNYTSSKENKILFIKNKDKRKDCIPDKIDFSGSVVDMTIGYKCINEQDITKLVVSMLRDSISQTNTSINSYDLMKKFADQKSSGDELVSANDRNYINVHYLAECAHMSPKAHLISNARRTFGRPDNPILLDFNVENDAFYKDKRWPLGIVMYGVDEDLKNNEDFKALLLAMSAIEMDTCVSFQEVVGDEVLSPKNVIWFGKEGDDVPTLGFQNGRQNVKLSSIVHGAPGHTAHALSLLMRTLGIPMASNRPDRHNHVNINWKYVLKGKEHLLEKDPVDSLINILPYDYASVTHAPANYMCDDNCAMGRQTVEPLQDHLWQRTMTMGRSALLSDGDKQYVKLLYGPECDKRFLNLGPGNPSANIGYDYTGDDDDDNIAYGGDHYDDDEDYIDEHNNNEDNDNEDYNNENDSLVKDVSYDGVISDSDNGMSVNDDDNFGVDDDADSFNDDDSGEDNDNVNVNSDLGDDSDGLKFGGDSDTDGDGISGYDDAGDDDLKFNSNDDSNVKGDDYNGNDDSYNDGNNGDEAVNYSDDVNDSGEVKTSDGKRGLTIDSKNVDDGAVMDSDVDSSSDVDKTKILDHNYNYTIDNLLDSTDKLQSMQYYTPSQPYNVMSNDVKKH